MFKMIVVVVDEHVLKISIMIEFVIIPIFVTGEFHVTEVQIAECNEFVLV